MKTRYIKRTYLYGKHEFSTYEPIELDIISEEYENGIARKIIHLIDGEKVSLCTNRYIVIVKTFSPNHKDILFSDYKRNPVFVSCHNNYLSGKGVPIIRHAKCEVLPYQSNNYTELICHCCGEKHKIALNSWSILEEGDKFGSDCDPKEISE